VHNVFILHLAERPKQLPRSGTIAALTIYVSHDLLLPLNVTATDSDVSLGFIKGRQLHRGSMLYFADTSLKRVGDFVPV